MANTIMQPCDAGVIRSRAVAAPREGSAGKWVLAATILGSSMASIDGTVVNVALPAIQRELDATASDAQWIVESYALLLAALILVGGSLGDHFGRRRVFGIGVALFAAASVACGLSQTAGQLIASRAVQGVGGALLIPGSLAIISASFSGADRGKAIGTWSGFSAITTALGPLLGGWLIDNASWRWAFLINVPLAAAVLAITFSRVPESRDEQAARGLDWAGAALATLGLGALVYGLTEAPVEGWGSALVLGALAVGVGALALFMVREARTRAPMMPLGLFRSRTFSGANLLTLLLYAAMGGALYYLPFNLIQVQGYDATAAGAAFLPMILIMFLGSRFAGGLITAYGARLPLVVGSYWTTFFPAVVVLGIGMTITVAPLTTTVMAAVPAHESGVASGINNAVSRTAGLLAIAAMGVLMAGAFGGTLDDRLGALDLPPEAAQGIGEQRDRLAGIEAPSGVSGEARAGVEAAIDESFLAGFQLVMYVAAGLALAGAASAAVLIEGKHAEQTNRVATQGGTP